MTAQGRVCLALVLMLALAWTVGCSSGDMVVAQPTEPTAGDYVRWGQLAEAGGQADMARQHFTSALALDPDSVEARHGLARLHMARQEYGEAWALLSEIRGLDADYFGPVIPEAAVAVYQWARELEVQGEDENARAAYLLTWDLCQEGGFRHPDAADLHFKIASFYWPSDDRADWSRALGHLHLASQARPAWAGVFVSIAEVAMAVSRPAESLWALSRARSLSARSLDDLSDEARHTLASLYLVRARELFENTEIMFGGARSGNRREDPGEYVDAAQNLVPDTIQLHYWLARIRLSSSDLKGARMHLARVVELAEAGWGDDSGLDQWWQVYSPVVAWLTSLLSGGPVPPPVTVTNHLAIRATPLMRPCARWAPSGYRIAYVSDDTLLVATPYQPGAALLGRVGDFHPHGPLAWQDEDTLVVSVLWPPEEEVGEDGDKTETPGLARLLRVSLSGEIEVIMELPGGWMTSDLDVHTFSGHIAVTMVPVPTEEEGSARDGYVIAVLDATGRELLSQHQAGTPDSIAWRPDGGAVMITDRPFRHFTPSTWELDVHEAGRMEWTGAGSRHPAQPLLAHGLLRTPWTDIRVGTGGSEVISGSQTTGTIPLVLEGPPVWSPDGRFLATPLRVAPGYGLSHIMVWRRSDGLPSGWLSSTLAMSWAADGSFVMWLTLEPSGYYRVNIGRWVGH